jgi:DNA-binding GntR family transcriptional regulator
MGTVLHIDLLEAKVYRALREEIVRLDLPPGARLSFEELARRYGVSHTPVRQALRQLERDGLVVTLPRRGSHVAPLSFDELEEIQCIRLGIETTLARLGAVACTPAVTEQLSKQLAAIDGAFVRNHLDQYLEGYRLLRDACYGCAGRPRLLHVAHEQRWRAERYLRFLCSDVEALAESHDHQVAFVAACRARDGRAAEAATRRALLWTLGRLGKLLDVRGRSAAQRAGRGP